MAREALAQYMARPPVSLKKMLVEDHAASVLYRSVGDPYFRTNSKLLPATEFLVEVLQHLPVAGTRLIRRRVERRTTSHSLLCASAKPKRTSPISPCPPESLAPLGRACSQRCTKLTPQGDSPLRSEQREPLAL